MRVVTFNIHHGTVGKDGPVDADLLAEVCVGFDADVIALQEVEVGTPRMRGVDLVGTVARACRAEHVVGPARRFGPAYQANALLVRGSIETWSVTRLPRVPSWQVWQERRSALTAAVLVQGRRWSVVTTHLAVQEEVNGPQLDEVLALSITQPPPLVVLGDLNRRPGFTGFTPVDHEPTYPADAPRAWLDHVLVSADVEVGTVEVRSTAMSDHAALLVDLHLAGDREGPQTSN